MVLAVRPGYIVCMDDERRSGVWAALAAPFVAGVLPSARLGRRSCFKHQTGLQRILDLRQQLWIQ